MSSTYRPRIAGTAALIAAAVACLFAFHRILVSAWCDADSLVLPSVVCGMHPNRWVTKGYSPRLFDGSRKTRAGEEASGEVTDAAAVGPHQEGLQLPEAAAADSHSDSAAGRMPDARTTPAPAVKGAKDQSGSTPAMQEQKHTEKQPQRSQQGNVATAGKKSNPASATSNSQAQQTASHAAHDSSGRRGGRLPPVREMFGAQEVMWEKPWAKPRGIFMLLNGCNHGPDGWWDKQPACPQCLGLPEEKAILKAGILRGYVGVALAVVVERNKMRCWANLNPPAWNTDMKATVSSMRHLIKREGWVGLPIYAWGGSAGGSFAARLPYYLPMRGIMVQLKSIRAEELDAEVQDPQTTEPWQYPKVFYTYNRRDPVAVERAKVYTDKLADQDREFVLVGADPQPVTPTFFATRIADINHSVSQQLYDALKQSGFLDDHDYLINDPRKTDKQWQPVLRAKVPYANTVRLERFVSPIFEELNWAYSNHQGVSDTTEPAFAFFEDGKRPNPAMLENPSFWELQKQQHGAS